MKENKIPEGFKLVKRGKILEFIMLRLSGTYTKRSQVYKTVEKALEKFSQEELSALSAMVLTST
jgi:hypothetical protein